MEKYRIFDKYNAKDVLDEYDTAVNMLTDSIKKTLDDIEAQTSLNLKMGAELYNLQKEINEFEK